MNSFCDNGNSVITYGHGWNFLTLFDSKTGVIKSRGELDFAPNYLCYFQNLLYLCHGKCISIFKPQK